MFLLSPIVEEFSHLGEFIIFRSNRTCLVLNLVASPHTHARHQQLLELALERIAFRTKTQRKYVAGLGIELAPPYFTVT